MLFEEKLRNQDNAHISALRLDKKGKPIGEKPAIVLKEPHHLSYPFLFQHQGAWYCCPEAASSGKITLYHAMSFPGEWQPVATLLDGVRAYDPT
jgi:hypothetical protein